MKHFFSLTFIILFIQLSAGQTINANLVEINSYSDGNPQYLTPSQNGFYISADYSTNGRELCYSDGTSTSLVKDIIPGSHSSDPKYLTMVNNTLFFTATDNINGRELWKSDGTEAGTVMVKDILPNSLSDFGPKYLTAYNGMCFFTARDDTHGWELWKSDGTEAGTVMVKDIHPNGDGNPRYFFVFNNILYFTAYDGVHGRELWRSNGTETGTYMVKDINPNLTSGLYGHRFLIKNNYFYFMADDGVHGNELWRSNGTSVGTTLVKDINPGPNSSSYNSLIGRTLNNSIIFEADDGVHGTELWKSSGTANGTYMLKDINSNAPSGLSYYDTRFVKFNNEVYFTADNGTQGFELWKTNGTSNGTVLVKDINPGPGDCGCGLMYADNSNNHFVFFAKDSDTADHTIWTSDGTTAGTIELSNDITYFYNTVLYGNKYVTIGNQTFFIGRDNIHGNEIWVTDYTPNGTSLFADLNHSIGSNPSKFTNVDGNLFFIATPYDYGKQLFKSDGTIAGTQLVKVIHPGGNCADELSEMKVINGILYFSGKDGTHGYELWRSDGTEAGTYMVKDIYPGRGSSMRNYNDKQKFWVINDILYFSAKDGSHGFELWRSDGTEAGTYMVKDIHPGSSSSYPVDFAVLNNTIYFIAHDNTGNALWTTDGTTAGTYKIINLYITALRALSDKLLIINLPSGYGSTPELWVSDGTATGTTFLQSFGGQDNINVTTIFNDELYFAARNPGSFKNAVYKTDGTVSGTILLFDAVNHPTMPNLHIDSLIPCGNYVYFTTNDGSVFPKEIWRTNGNITEMIADQNTPNHPYIRNLTCYKNKLLYLTGSYPHNIWMVNDNINTSVPLDINFLNGPNLVNNDNIEGIGATDNHLYLRARNSYSGSELYITDYDATPSSIEESIVTANNKFDLIKLYPNPTESSVTIESNTNSDIEKFEILDLSGKIVHKQSGINTSIFTYDTNKLSSSIYFVKVYLSNKETSTLKLIVKK